jgi:hypothetical protein
MFVLYGGGKAYLYLVEINTVDSDLGVADMDVELVGVLNSVTADAITSTNFGG